MRRHAGLAGLTPARGGAHGPQTRHHVRRTLPRSDVRYHGGTQSQPPQQWTSAAKPSGPRATLAATAAEQANELGAMQAEMSALLAAKKSMAKQAAAHKAEAEAMQANIAALSAANTTAACAAAHRRRDDGAGVCRSPGPAARRHGAPAPDAAAHVPAPEWAAAADAPAGPEHAAADVPAPEWAAAAGVPADVPEHAAADVPEHAAAEHAATAVRGTGVRPSRHRAYARAHRC